MKIQDIMEWSVSDWANRHAEDDAWYDPRHKIGHMARDIGNNLNLTGWVEPTVDCVKDPAQCYKNWQVSTGRRPSTKIYPGDIDPDFPIWDPTKQGKTIISKTK